jgi:DNA modification methylase
MNRLTILSGDCRDILPTLEAGSVQCCVTSPPYWGLRDYGTAQWEGGEDGCDHQQNISLRRDSPGGFHNSTSRGTQASTISVAKQYSQECGKCGARRIDSQLGLESSPEEYIANMVAVFREVKRVLRDDGTLWVNMGDSYCGSPTGKQSNNEYVNGNKGDGAYARRVGRMQTGDGIGPMNSIRSYDGLKSKDLCMMPARLAMALQADGWYLRSEIVWHKPNPMPESCMDRPTKSHEMIYLLAKQERYFYDAEAIREPADKLGTLAHLAGGNGERAGSREGLRRDKWLARKKVQEPDFQPLTESEVLGEPLSRNKRSVWTIATQPYAEAHFATFPEEIPKLCILAGSKVGDTILDPFAGTGTVGQVALELGRRAILIELNPAYIELAKDRTFVTPGFL